MCEKLVYTAYTLETCAVCRNRCAGMMLEFLM